MTLFGAEKPKYYFVHDFICNRDIFERSFMFNTSFHHAFYAFPVTLHTSFYLFIHPNFNRSNFTSYIREWNIT